MPAAMRRPLFNVYPHSVARAQLRGSKAVEQLADDFRCLVAAAGGVTEDELLPLGWTRSQLAVLGDAARTRAFAQAAG